MLTCLTTYLIMKYLGLDIYFRKLYLWTMGVYKKYMVTVEAQKDNGDWVVIPPLFFDNEDEPDSAKTRANALVKEWTDAGWPADKIQATVALISQRRSGGVSGGEL